MNVQTPLYIIHGTECRRLTAQGVSQTDIARTLGISHNTVAYALMDEAGREKVRHRHKLANQLDHGPVHKFRIKPKMGRPLPLAVISKEDKDAAVLAFAKFEIPLAEMMRRITPSHKWRKEWAE